MSSAMMKAIRLHEFGGPDVLRYEDAPKPTPKAGEVLIRCTQLASIRPTGICATE
jgi:NADPH:quinone reductase-like Zn-dependent oxidoreductase